LVREVHGWEAASSSAAGAWGACGLVEHARLGRLGTQGVRSVTSWLDRLVGLFGPGDGPLIYHFR
jgi:hypothetical protein